MKNLPILFSWIGNNDLTDIDKSTGFGAIVSICLTYPQIDKLVLLTNRDSKEIKDYVAWIRDRQEHKVDIILELCNKNPDPTDYKFIYESAESVVRKHIQPNSEVYFNLTSGTPTMSATWLLLGTSIFNATLLQSSKEKGVEIIELPYQISLQAKQDQSIEQLTEIMDIDDFSNELKAMANVDELVTLFAPRNIPVIIQGETGSGKEVLAKKIHAKSLRKDNVFIAINCGAISENLVDSELFGHKKGTFTGADKDRKGHFENAHGGTLFLDEIGELPLSSQVKLLRVLQEKEVTAVGSSLPRKIDVRVICATHRDLLEMVQQGNFREDLYYRLAVGMIEIPPLRERGGDIAILAKDLLSNINLELVSDSFTKKTLTQDALKFISAQYWAGNVRELQNTLLRACIRYPFERQIQAKHIEAMMIKISHSQEPRNNLMFALPVNAPEKIKEIKRIYAEKALKVANNRKNRAGKFLGISSQVLDNWSNL